MDRKGNNVREWEDGWEDEEDTVPLLPFGSNENARKFSFPTKIE